MFTVRKHPVLAWLITGYVTFIVLWLLLRALFFDQFWPLALLNTIAEYLFIPLPLFLLVGIWQRRWPALLLLGIPTVAFVVLFGELFWPLESFPHSDGRVVFVAASRYRFTHYH